jgi:hypothetical protein
MFSMYMAYLKAKYNKDMELDGYYEMAFILDIFCIVGIFYLIKN